MHHKVLFTMDEKEQSLQQLRDIKTMMERSSRFISLSGMSGVFAGFFALAGAAAFHIFLNQRLSYGYHSMASRLPIEVNLDFLFFCALDALVVLTLSIGFGVFFTTKKAKSDGLKIWDRNARLLLVNLAIPLITGGLFCAALLYHGLFGLVAPCTLIFYGLALLNASKFTLDEIRWLGISEIILGLIACWFVGYGITFWALGFGMLHIIYGLLMYLRYEAKPSEKKYW